MLLFLSIKLYLISYIPLGFYLYKKLKGDRVKDEHLWVSLLIVAGITVFYIVVLGASKLPV